MSALLVLFLMLIAVVDGTSSAAPPAVTRPRFSLRPEHGFFDDAWAVDPAGARLAVIETDRATFQKVEIYASAADSSQVKPLFTFDLPPPLRALESMAFWPDGAGLLLISGAGPDLHLVESIDTAGKVVGKVTSVFAFGFATMTGEARLPVLVAVERRPGTKGQVTYVVTPLRFPGLKPAAKARRYEVAADGTLRPEGLLPVGFFDGYSKLLAQRPGRYDKKKDARQPDAQAVLDLLAGKLLGDAPIEDVYGFARTSRLRRERPNRTAFVQLADTISTPGNSLQHKPDSGVELVDPAGGLVALPLAVPFRLYDRFTLNDQEGPQPDTVHFGIQIDPVNPDAVARKKADQPFLDVYTIPLAHPADTRLRARVALDSQPTVWAVAGAAGRPPGKDRLQVLVVFHRFKSFARGGDHIDVYDLGP